MNHGKAPICVNFNYLTFDSCFCVNSLSVSTFVWYNDCRCYGHVHVCNDRTVRNQIRRWTRFLPFPIIFFFINYIFNLYFIWEPLSRYGKWKWKLPSGEYRPCLSLVTMLTEAKWTTQSKTAVNAATWNTKRQWYERQNILSKTPVPHWDSNLSAVELTRRLETGLTRSWGRNIISVETKEKSSKPNSFRSNLIQLYVSLFYLNKPHDRHLITKKQLTDPVNIGSKSNDEKIYLPVDEK